MITIENLSKSYKDKQIFQNFNTTFKDKTLTVLLGENGAGKSTLLRIVTALEKANGGTVKYFGERLSNREIKEKIGYIPQDIALFEHLTVNENIEFFKALSKQSISSNLIEDYCEKLNLFERKAKISALSGGTKRKVNLLIGLLSNPSILILDEPTVGIDLKSRYDIHQLLNSLKESRLIILTTHHLDEVESLADEIKLIGKDSFYRNILSEKGWEFEDSLHN
ncbi:MULTISPECIES: ABC transporter ATP-binding protein [Mammaliicoccus]|uniref:ABC transporter ATP-binding protein n=1 Tax=Mammaliicoccus fleurettii TaxID=150056 RepID=A0ABS5MLR4_9STAP|nr:MULTISPECIES: ABC transporter ATP-binding protein [Mammaliicoccus]HCN61045.1 ABC transporter ATP-binding protein [Staphylococcus sp.]MBL0846374.1 ABC transporter ATP-binding protein [Mammaliicoccus fleurettii]MBS3671450.1 ABC transporter ATP-binding protein [Mammaliicoccus fleurettii]MBS3696596.1 ABC transporter ATP-binding protein [Mammaliicoccus fleurettii]MBW0764959.1 ABC transporter ATP-binding protein [Mammaliicoccus fleurettii]